MRVAVKNSFCLHYTVVLSAAVLLLTVLCASSGQCPFVPPVTGEGESEEQSSSEAEENSETPPESDEPDSEEDEATSEPTIEEIEPVEEYPEADELQQDVLPEDIPAEFVEEEAFEEFAQEEGAVFEPIEVRVAILDLTQRSGMSEADFYGIKHSLEAMGLPFVVANNVADSAQFPMVVVAGNVADGSLTTEEESSLVSYVSGGGVLVANKVTAASLFPLFGVTASQSSVSRVAMTFEAESADPALKYINHPNETSLRFASEAYPQIFDTKSYELGVGRALAHYDDESTALVTNDFGTGHTYLLGIRYADSVLRPQVNADFEAQRTYSNGVEPGADVFMLLLRAIYEEYLPVSFRKDSVPNGRAGALILTHDVDAQQSFQNARIFADLEDGFSVKSSFNITTKYFVDSQDAAYYTPANVVYLAEVHQRGFDVESHSVGHFPDFRQFPLGDPDVTRETYNPHYDTDHTTGGTVYGEVKVSKALLEQDIPGLEVVLFRSGYFAFSGLVPSALEATGYLCDSSNSANDLLTNYPFFLISGMSMSGGETDIIEIPNTISDHSLDAGNVPETVQGWVQVLDANIENNAVTTFLVHTTNTDFKLEAERQLLLAAADRDLWIGDLRTFHDFWRARYNLGYSLEKSNSVLVIRLDNTLDEIFPKTTLSLVDRNNEFSRIRVLDSQGEPVPFTKTQNHLILVPEG